MDEQEEKQQIMKEVQTRMAEELRVLEGAINLILEQQFQEIGQRIGKEIMEKFGIKVDVSIPGIRWEAISQQYPFILENEVNA